METLSTVVVRSLLEVTILRVSVIMRRHPPVMNDPRMLNILLKELDPTQYLYRYSPLFVANFRETFPYRFDASHSSGLHFSNFPQQRFTNCQPDYSLPRGFIQMRIDVVAKWEVESSVRGTNGCHGYPVLPKNRVALHCACFGGIGSMQIILA